MIAEAKKKGSLGLSVMSKYLNIKSLFEAQADEERAVAMAAYQKNLFEFYGIPTPQRRKIYAEFLKAEKKTKTIDWEFLDACYADPHREFQYLAYDYLLRMQSYLVYEDLAKVEHYVLTKSWWDTIDFLTKVVGQLGLRDNRVKNLMLGWSKRDNIWIRWTAIEHQLGLKEQTDTDLLAEIIVNCLGSDEFFINKAIGWSLRDYSKTNPDWVRDFIWQHEEQMAKLSIREASKYL